MKEHTANLSHANSISKAGSNLGETKRKNFNTNSSLLHSVSQGPEKNAAELSSVLQDSPSPTSPRSPQTATLQKRIPEGVVTGEIPLEAAKAYPIRVWTGTDLRPRIAYADLNTKGEKNTLSVKLLPDGGKTAPHPQIVLFVNGMYHVETLGYTRSNPWKWTTWLEVHVDALFLQALIDALYKAKFELEKRVEAKLSRKDEK